MDVRIFTRCIETKETQNLNFKLINDINCVWGLKKALETKISVAACDQKVYYRNRLLDNEIILSSLYVREGDCFTVEYVAHCNIEALVVVLHRMKEFLTIVAEINKGIETLSLTTENLDELSNCCDDVYQAFEMCSSELFLPWKNKSSIANRHFFTQEGGLSMLSSIYKFTSKHFSFGERLHEETVMLLKNNQILLEYGCLIALWNYSELKEDRRKVLNEIDLDLFLKSLVRQGENNDELFEICQINEAAVGCLAQYMEMSDIQQMVTEDLEAVIKLVSLSSQSTSVYGKEVAANALFCCSNHPKAAEQLVKNKIHEPVMEMMQPILFTSEQNGDLDVFDDLSKPTMYFFCLFLANILTLPKEKTLGEQEKHDIDSILEKFLALVTPSQIGKFEATHSYVWISMAPFVQTALFGVGAQPVESLETAPKNKFHLKDNTLDDCSSHGVNQRKEWISQYSFSSAAKLGLFSLCHLTKLKENRELFQREQLVDFLVCICWFAKKCGHHGNFLVPELTGFEDLHPPSLQSIAKAYLVKCHGYKLTHEI